MPDQKIITYIPLRLLTASLIVSSLLFSCKKEDDTNDNSNNNGGTINPVGFNASQTYQIGPVANGQYFNFSYSETVMPPDYSYGDFSAYVADDGLLNIQFPYWSEEDNQAYLEVFISDVPNSIGTHQGCTLSHLDGSWVHYCSDLTVTITEVSNTIGGTVKGTFSGPCTSAYNFGLDGNYDTNCNGSFTVPYYE